MPRLADTLANTILLNSNLNCIEQVFKGKVSSMFSFLQYKSSKSTSVMPLLHDFTGYNWPPRVAAAKWRLILFTAIKEIS